jgi:Uma2 family endonuclease
MATTKLWTAEEIEAMPESDIVIELWDGEIRTMSPTGFRHGEIALAIGAHLLTYLRMSGAGRVTGTDSGFVLGRDPDLLLAPDVAVVLGRQAPSPRGYSQAIPALVVEVISETESATDVERKIQLYRNAGVPLIWTVYPETRSVRIDEANREIRFCAEGGSLDGGAVLPGMPPLPLTEVFE